MAVALCSPTMAVGHLRNLYQMICIEESASREIGSSFTFEQIFGKIGLIYGIGNRKRAR